MISNKMEDLYPLIIEAFNNNQKFKFPVKGTSMRPMLKDNDSVTIEKVNNVIKGDIILYRRDNGQFVLHRIIKVHDNLYDIVGDHQTGIEYNVRYDQLIGKVISYNKKGKEKEYKLLGLRYKLYKFSCKFKLRRWLNSKLS